MKNYFAIMLAAFIIVARLSAQEAPKVKFEKVSKEEMDMTVYESDTTANAVILFDDGRSEVRYTVENGFMLTYDRFVRIKILKQSGTNWANFSIPLYSSPKNKEDILSVKGVTSNLENGKIVKTDMKKDAIFRERENKYWEMVRVTLPSVKVGSVIDLKYSISSPFLWNLRSWKFQYLIPVKWSQYEVIYPEYFVYNHSSMGYHRLNKQEHTTSPVNINYSVTTQTGGSGFSGGGQRQQENRTISYLANIYRYAANDIPAMKEEPYLTTLDNYTTKLKFELAVVDLTKVMGEYKAYNTSWNDVAKELLDDDDFGNQINSANFAKDEIASLIAGKTDEKQKIAAIYNSVQHSVKWNGNRNYMPSKPLRRIFIDKNGNSADVNLLLVAMLNEAGLKAYPVILSTRSNGIISPVHASISDCDYVIARVMVDSTSILLDATEPNLPAGILPFRCLNGSGRLIKKDAVEEVELTDPKSVSVTMASIELKDGKFTGNIVFNEGGLNAFNFREAVKNAGGEKEYFETLRNQSTDIQYKDYSYKNLDNIDLAIEKKYQIDIQNESEADADILYFNPVIVNRLEKNPFTSPTRVYPIDYGVTSSDVYQLNLVIPKGYMVEELPKNKSFVLPDKTASFIYTAVQTGNTISFSMRLNISKTLFLPDEYLTMQDFYNRIVAKQTEQIVLKKIKE